MKYALGNMLNGAGGLNADQLALDLQFAADKTLTARKGPTPVLTRGSTGTFVGSNGLIQTAAVNAARFDHDPVTLASRGLLIEEGRTNLALQSEDFSTALWTKSNVTVAANTEISPDGTLSADTATINSTAHNIAQSTTVTPLAIYTFSFYVKRGSATDLRYSIVNFITFANIVSPTSYYAQTSASNWVRVSVSFTVPSGCTSIGIYPLRDGGATGTVHIWGAQLEAGSFATSYIPTTTSALARSADVCSITGANFTSFWNNNEGTVFASGDPRTSSAGVGTYLMANSGSNTSQVSIYRNATTNTYGVANSGSYTANISTSAANGSFNKIAGSYITNDARAAFNNVLGTQDTSVIVPTNLTRLNIGSSGTANQELANGCIAAVRYYKKPLSNAKLQALTA